jgi:hypothetical protein
MEYYSGIKRSEVLIHATKQKKLMSFILSGRSQTQKPQIAWFHDMKCSKWANP